MGKHTIFGVSTVASSWREAWRIGVEGTSISRVISIAGQPDQKLNLGDTIIMTWESSEWKGFLRGGTIVRKMVFVVKEGTIVSRSSENLDRIAM